MSKHKPGGQQKVPPGLISIEGQSEDAGLCVDGVCAIAALEPAEPSRSVAPVKPVPSKPLLTEDDFKAALPIDRA